MSKATEAQLAELHAAVAGALTAVVKEEAPSAAHIMAAISFLKNNNITADAETNSDLKALGEALKEKRARNKMNLTTLRGVADEIDRDLGGSLLS